MAAFWFPDRAVSRYKFNLTIALGVFIPMMSLITSKIADTLCERKVTTTANAPKGFKVHPRRWVVERTCGWLVSYQRRGKDYERHIETGEATIYVAMIHLMLR